MDVSRVLGFDVFDLSFVHCCVLLIFVTRSDYLPLNMYCSLNFAIKLMQMCPGSVTALCYQRSITIITAINIVDASKWNNQ